MFLLRAAEQATTTHEAAAREPASPRTPAQAARAGWRRLVAAFHTLDDSCAGDWIGGAAIVVMFIAGLWIGCGLGWEEILK